MRAFVTLTALCLVLSGCGGSDAPQTFTIQEGETVTYEVGVAHVGDTILCETEAGSIGAQVQKRGMGAGAAGSGASGGRTGNVGGSIDVATNDDGSVVASCDG